MLIKIREKYNESLIIITGKLTLLVWKAHTSTLEKNIETSAAFCTTYHDNKLLQPHAICKMNIATAWHELYL